MPTVTLTKRQVVLIRVALIQRLDRLKNHPHEDMQASYVETRDLLCKELGIHLEKESTNA